MSDEATGEFNLDEVKANYITAEQHREEVSRRDSKINELITEGKKTQKAYDSKFGELNTTIQSLNDRLSSVTDANRRSSFELTDEEQTEIGDYLPAFNKVVGSQLSDSKREIENLKTQLANTQSVTNSDLDARIAKLDSVISATARNAIGSDKYKNDQDFLNWASKEKYSKIGDATILDVFNANDKVQPNDQYYTQSISEQQAIIDAYLKEGKKINNTVVNTSGQYENTQTPQQKKLESKLTRLKKQKRNLLNNNDIPGAYKMNSEIESLELELMAET